MIWLSGGHSKRLCAALPPEVGWMLQPGKGNRPHGDRPWAADSGCFARPDRYTDDGYLRWLERLRPYAGRCLFATAPDVVGDALATLALSAPMLRRLRSEGWPAALAGYDSADGTELVFRPDEKLRKVQGWFRDLRERPALPLW